MNYFLKLGSIGNDKTLFVFYESNLYLRIIQFQGMLFLSLLSHLFLLVDVLIPETPVVAMEIVQRNDEELWVTS